MSAGLLMYRWRDGAVQVLVGHPGGPLWARKDAGAWSIPKGLVEDGEDLLLAARREFSEETGFSTPDDGYLSLGTVQLASRKRVHGWAFEGECDPAALASNRFTMTWPPRSGNSASFPELDRVLWATTDVARDKLNPAQVAFVDRLLAHAGRD